MASPTNRPCVLSRKRQHNLNDQYEVDDVVLSTSQLSTLDEMISEAKKSKTSESSVALQKSTADDTIENSVCSQKSTADHSESEDEQCESDNTANNIAEPEVADVPLVDITAVSEEEPKSPQPGPSRYEDITFEPAVTSTPHHNQEDAVEDLNETKEIDFHKEMEHGRDCISKIEKEFVEDFRNSVRKKTAKHILKLKERKEKVLKAMVNAKKDIERLESFYAFLSSHKNDIDSSLNKCNYLIERYPY